MYCWKHLLNPTNENEHFEARETDIIDNFYKFAGELVQTTSLSDVAQEI